MGGEVAVNGPKEGSIEKVVEAAVQAQVQKMIVESLEGVDGLVGRLVAGAMQVNVKDGYREIPFIQKLCRDAVHQAASDAMKAWLTEHAADIQREVERQFTLQKKELAASLVGNLVEAAGSAYRFRVTIDKTDN